MNLPAYPKYKNSGVAWLGMVPEGWEVKKIGWFATVKSGDALVGDAIEPIKTHDVSIPVIGGNGLMGYSSQANIYEPTIVIGRVGALCGNVHLISVPAWVTDNALVMKLVDNFFAIKYISKVLISRNLNEIADKTAQPLITGSRVKSEYIPLPPLSEQQAIAAFLDRETTKIDALVEKQRRMLNLLKEKRTALISHAVTKGLNPDAKLKDSGVAWLGMVPEGWDVKKLGHLCSKIGSGKTPSGGAETYVAEGILFLRSQNIYDEGLHLEDAVYIDEDVDSEMSNSRVLKHDILLNITGASLGRTCIVPDEFLSANVNQHVCIIRLVNFKFAEYVSLFLKSAPSKAQLAINQNGAAREGLNFVQISKIVLPLPPLPEQQAIAAFLDRETAKIDALVARIKDMIAKLQEYRTALITAAVTGKVDVRTAEETP